VNPFTTRQTARTVVADYTDDAVFITPAGVQRGKDGIRPAFTQLLTDVPNAAWDLKPRSMNMTSSSWNGPLTLPRLSSKTASTRSCSGTA
jgi:hypothetical protein